MKLKELFCWHKTFIAIDAYYKKEKTSPNFTAVGYREPIVLLECNKCKKKIEMYLSDMQYKRHEFTLDVDVTPLEKYTFFGGKEEVKESMK